MIIDKAIALQSLRKGAEWVIRGDKLEWLDKVQTQPTEEEIEQEIVRLEQETVLKKQAQVAARQSALNKLMALGLTEEEALALGVK